MTAAPSSYDATVRYLVAADLPDAGGWALRLCEWTGTVYAPTGAPLTTEHLHQARDLMPLDLWQRVTAPDKEPFQFTMWWARLYPEGKPVQFLGSKIVPGQRPQPQQPPQNAKVVLGAKVTRRDGSWHRPATVYGATYQLGIDAGVLRQIPFKPRGTKGRQWHGWVKDPLGNTVWKDKVGGSWGARGLLEEAALVPHVGCRLFILLTARDYPVAVVNAATALHALDAAGTKQRLSGPLRALAREDCDGIRWHQLLAQWQRTAR